MSTGYHLALFGRLAFYVILCLLYLDWGKALSRMRCDHLLAIFGTLVFYVFLSASYWGWGKALLVSVGRRSTSATTHPGVTSTIWGGWASTLFILELIHLLLPLTAIVVTPVFVLGIALAIAFAIRHRHSCAGNAAPDHTRCWFRATAILMVMAPASVWIASRSMLAPSAYDSGLYHFNAIRWINSFPIVPGLGNLHGRLAFNQSFFTYVAACNLHPFFGHGRSIANSFLFLLTLYTLIESALPILKRPKLALQLHPLQWAPGILALPVLAFWALSSDGLASPSPDLTCGLLQLVIFVMLGQIVADMADNGKRLTSDPMVLSILAATAVTVKLSNLAFCSAVIALLVWGVVRNSAGKSRVAHLARVLVGPLLIFMAFGARGVLLSGAPLFPSTIGYVHADWSVPVVKVVEEANITRCWARQPRVHYSTVLGNWNWLGPWFQRVTSDFKGIVYPVAVFLVTGVSSILLRLCSAGKPSRQGRADGNIMLLPLVAGLLFWFLAAPDPRFAGALFLLMPVSVITGLVARLQSRVRSVSLLLVFTALFIVDNLALGQWAYVKRWKRKEISFAGWQDVKRVELCEKSTNSGLRILTPVTGDQCWDGPLPCTPRFDENLRLRGASLSSGFTVSSAEARGAGAR